jgi:serine/threonine protein kinase
MDFKLGDRLGDRYVLNSKLGEGGFGEVWKARDTELDRDVALKVSKAEFTARFKQEARTIAAFNHPNICQIYDVGSNYIVMELIDGVQLSGPMPVDKAVACAGQILDALDAAHRKKFTHRDLKPANVMVMKSGAIKLLDFGLAKQQPAELGSDDETRAAPKGLSKDHGIVGTLQYMSPEQLQGKEADARSDIFAFGCVLYEMLSAKKAFSGSTTASVIAAIMERDPEPLQTTPPLDRVIRTCLEKDPDERFQNARDVKKALLWAMETTAVSALGRTRLPWVLLAATAAIAVALGVLYFRAGTAAAPETRTDIVTPPTTSPASFALSPDGRKIAYVATSDGVSRLWVHPLDSISAQALPGTENALNPFWSPDGRSLGFFADGKLKRIDLGGGQPQTLAEISATTGGQGAWDAEGTILFNPNGTTVGPLLRISAPGGQAVAASKLGKAEAGHHAPRFLPGGRQFLFAASGTGAASALWLGSLDGTGSRRIAAYTPGTESAAEYLPPGWLVRVRQNVLAAERFDAASGQLSGDPVTLAQAVGLDPNTQSGSFSVSPSGTIAWRGGAGNRRQLTWSNRSGQNVGTLGAPDDTGLALPELSPDGRRAAVTRGSVGSRDIWIYEGARSNRFTFDAADDLDTIWSPDGSRVVFTSTRKGSLDLYRKPADGSGSEELLRQSADDKRPDSWSPDGRFILYNSSQNNGDLMVLPLGADRKPFPFLSTQFNENQGVFSPDGKWVAYQSNESGRFEIYVRPFPGPGGQWQVSTGGGTMPRWSKEGRVGNYELFYLAPDRKMMAVAATSQGGTFVPGMPEVLFQTRAVLAVNRQSYDVARDGRFLINIDLQDTSTEPIHLLLNWRPPGK